MAHDEYLEAFTGSHSSNTADPDRCSGASLAIWNLTRFPQTGRQFESTHSATGQPHLTNLIRSGAAQNGLSSYLGTRAVRIHASKNPPISVQNPGPIMINPPPLNFSKKTSTKPHKTLSNKKQTTPAPPSTSNNTPSPAAAGTHDPTTNTAPAHTRLPHARPNKTRHAHYKGPLHPHTARASLNFSAVAAAAAAFLPPPPPD